MTAIMPKAMIKPNKVAVIFVESDVIVVYPSIRQLMLVILFKSFLGHCALSHR